MFLRRQHQVSRATPPKQSTQGHKPQSDTSATNTSPGSTSKLRQIMGVKEKDFPICNYIALVFLRKAGSS